MSTTNGTDAKIKRIEASWLHADPTAAAWLAAAADEVVVRGQTLRADRFAYIGLDQGAAGLVVRPGTDPAVIECPTDVLVLRSDLLDEADRRIPALAAA